MTGFDRGLQRQALPRETVVALATAFVAKEVAARENAARDPFGVNHDCRNPAGHEFFASCGQVVCVHCARVAWL